MNNKNFHQQIRDHLQRKGRSKNTADQYVSAYKRYEERTGGILTQKAVNDFLSEPSNNNTVNRAMLKNVLNIKGVKEVDIPDYKNPPRKHPSTLKDYEIDLLIEEVDPEYKLCIMLMDECGLRVSEAVSIKHEHIDYEKGHITVTGKGGYQRRVYPSNLLLGLLRKGQSSHGVLSGYVFPSPVNEGAHIHTNTIRHHMKKVLPHSHPHMLRHSFATRVYEENDGDLLATKDLLGHANIDTTTIYAKVSNLRAKEAAKKAWRHEEE